MKPHPCTSILHEFLERFSLFWLFRARVEKKDHLIPGKKCGVEIVPVISRVVGKIVDGRVLCKPFIGFMKIADVGHVFMRRVKRDSLEWVGLRKGITGSESEEEANEGQANSIHLKYGLILICCFQPERVT